MKTKLMIAFLILMNLSTLFGLWYYHHNYSEMVKVAQIGEKLHLNEEWLIVTRMAGRDGYERVFAAPMVMRTAEQCQKSVDEIKNVYLGLEWHCEQQR